VCLLLYNGECKKAGVSLIQTPSKRLKINAILLILEPLLQKIVPMVSASFDHFLFAFVLSERIDSADFQFAPRLMALGGGAARGAFILLYSAKREGNSFRGTD
jgi:hypothetical protein